MLEMVLGNAGKISYDITIVYSDFIKPYLDEMLGQDHPYNLILQPEPLGTGHAVYCALDSIDLSKPTIVLYADNPFINDAMISSMLSQFRANNAKMMVMAFERDDPTGYGRLILDSQNMVTNIVECKDALSPQEKAISLCNSGIMLFESNVLKESLYELMAHYKSTSNEYYLTSLIEIAYKYGYKTNYFTTSGSAPLGVNTQEELKTAQGLV